MSTAIILCSRKHSSRVPGKCFIKYQEIYHIEHLVRRLIKSDIPLYLAVPAPEVNDYMFLMEKYPNKVFISTGFDSNPLGRIHACAKQNNIDTIIRVTHDKIFVSDVLLNSLLDVFKRKSLDYLYSSDFIPGTGFEIMSFDVIEKAAQRYGGKNIEHISYAIKATTENKLNYEMMLDCDLRLLVDYPEDVQMMDLLFTSLGPDCSIDDVFSFYEEHPWIKNINKLPDVTIYTCAYNAEKWIEEAMGSVAMQENFKNYEYLIIDDASQDKTILHASKFCQTYKNTKYYKNISNVGLSSSSNRALNLAKGEYIIRLDADDYFTNKTAVSDLVNEIDSRSLDAVYPNCYAGVGRKNIQLGKENHHAGGTIYRTSALNHIKFTDKLRNYEGLDLWVRAKEQVRIGYLNKPTFVYRQTPSSMSKTNIKEREKIKNKILGGTSESGETQVRSS